MESIKYEVILLSKSETIDSNETKTKIDEIINDKELKTGDFLIINDHSYFIIEQNDNNYKLIKSVEMPIIDNNNNNNNNKWLTIPEEVSKRLLLSKVSLLNYIKNYQIVYKNICEKYKNCCGAIELNTQQYSTFLKNHLKQNDMDHIDQLRLFYVFKSNSGYFISTKMEFLLNNQFNFSYRSQIAANLFDLSQLYCEEDNGESEDVNSMDMETLALDSNIINDESMVIMDDNDTLDPLPSDDQRDFEMEAFSEQFKKIYENEFKTYLKGLTKGQTIYATSLPKKPFNKETFEQDENDSTTLVFYFDSLEIDDDGHINCVDMLSFDKSEKCRFYPFLYKRYGQYYNITLFTTLYNVGRETTASRAEEFFLDLPVDLYNMIDD
jgi:hypothetical protein